MKKALLILVILFTSFGLLGGILLHLTENIDFVSALFTAFSCLTLTGLKLFPIKTTLSLSGQILLLLLIEIGTITLLTYINHFFRKTYSYLYSFIEVSIITIAIQIIGTLGIFFTQDQKLDGFTETSDQLFLAIFHSVNAFSNTGLSLLENNLIGTNSYVQLVIMCLMILGVIGIPALRELIYPDFVRSRIRNPETTWSSKTQIAVYSTMILGIIGFILIATDIFNFKDLKAFDKIVYTLFHSIASRTGGFHSIHLNELGLISLISMLTLMIIGGSSGSANGGIKTGTIIQIFSGKRNSNFKNALTILLFSLSCIVILNSILLFTDSELDKFALFFEQLSAFTTTGFSLGITSSLSNPGKLILILSMLLGKLGILSLFMSSNKE